jgi:hypothetical protein
MIVAVGWMLAVVQAAPFAAQTMVREYPETTMILNRVAEGTDTWERLAEMCA